MYVVKCWEKTKDTQSLCVCVCVHLHVDVCFCYFSQLGACALDDTTMTTSQEI